MREIKFRAWDEHNKVLHKDVEFIRSGIEDNDWIIFKSDKQRLEDKVVLDNPYFQKQIKLMQYTGFKDKNEVEIYEGDIIEYMTGQLKHIPTKHKVTWLKDEARFSFGCKANTQYMFYNTEVIGNIYENPELLQGD